MQPSMFNVRVPLPDRDEVFLMNTFTDAQIVVSTDVVSLLDSLEPGPDAPAGTRAARTFSDEERGALEALATNGFLVSSRTEERARLDTFFHEFRESTEQLRVTVLTTLQCNFACDYCIQGDHGDYNKHAHKMSMETAAELATWAESQMDALKPASFVLTFFGGEPLLNLPVMYYLAERLGRAADARGVRQLINVITNGLLLTPEVVARLKPFGLNGVKITLDGDQATHDRMRPLRGGQGTFERIVRNIRAIAGQCRIAIGGNFDADSVDSYPALLDFLAAQDFASDIGKVSFKPVIKAPASAPARPPAQAQLAAVGAPVNPAKAKGIIPLTLVSDKPLGGSCMTAAGTGAATAARASSQTSACDTCHFADDKMAFLRDETRRHGFATLDGVHMGPCELHRRHAHTIGPDGTLYACPGFAGDASLAVGRIPSAPGAGVTADRATSVAATSSDRARAAGAGALGASASGAIAAGATAAGASAASADAALRALRARVAADFDRHAPWKACGDCSYIPVCGGGCSVAAHTELGDMHAPSCHKRSFDAGLQSLAYQAAAVA